ncbi:MAG: ABC transporter permease [Candidatus Aminicenantes bacterium]|nr:ABC transporter permease [Candidatus Aminicenantes bacterium]
MIRQVLFTEFLKLRRSKITWLSLLAFSLVPLGGGLFMWIVREPGRAAKLGLLGTKASFVGLEATWAGYFGMLVQAVGIVGMLLLSVIAAYLFGREYSERTAKNMLALPAGRHWFALAKFCVALAWFGAIIVFCLAESFAVGALLGLPGLTAGIAARGIGEVLLASGISFLVMPVTAWIATLGKGYLPPLGFAILTLLLGTILGATGWGKWFPWSIVPLFAGTAGPRAETLAPASLVVVVLTFAVGVVATIVQYRWADNTQ